MKTRASLWLAVSTVLAAGCGGPPFSLSGSVTYEGRPIPAGEIVFRPDTAKGNQGPGVLAEIKDGRYQMPRGKGHVGGAYLVRVSGFDGVPPPTTVGPPGNRYGHPLFRPYDIAVELPRQSATQDFDVPTATPNQGKRASSR